MASTPPPDDEPTQSASATDATHAPRGDLVIRTVAMPADTNPAGDIFGGWLMSQMDLAGGVHAHHIAQGRVVTVAVDSMTFHLPVKVGDLLCCYAEVIRAGKTSLTLRIEAWALRRFTGISQKVTAGTFTFVALDDEGRKRDLPDSARAHTNNRQ